MIPKLLFLILPESKAEKGKKISVLLLLNLQPGAEHLVRTARII